MIIGIYTLADQGPAIVTDDLANTLQFHQDKISQAFSARKA
jgi:hypothetical protein